MREDRIRSLRFTDLTVKVLGKDGKPLRGAAVDMEQTSHAFLFGNIGFDLVPSVLKAHSLGSAAPGPSGIWDAERISGYKERITELFNAVTLPFYWGRFEPEEGKPHTEELKETARWFRDRGFTLKGHPLCWHTVCAEWLLKYPETRIMELQKERIRREVGAFEGLIDAWDVVNEAVIMPRFDKYDNAITRLAKAYGRDEVTDAMFREARAAGSKAVLLINDFLLTPEYEELIERLLARGTPIDVIGLQTHQHQGYHGAEKLWSIAERFSRFGLPLHFTENTLVSGSLMPPEIVDLNDFKADGWPTTPEGEERQMREAVEMYSTLYAHPAVEAITWWGLADGGWLGAPNGLVRRDMSPKPAFTALKDLIKGEWWTGKQTLKTDSEGRVRLTASLGTYKAASRGQEARFSAARGQREVEIRLGA